MYPPLSDIEKELGHTFKKPELLETALTHRSFINEHAATEHNERLEFLGDAVLELVVTEYLFAAYPDKPEGELTTLRSALVKGERLAELSTELELGAHLRMSRGEARSGGRSKNYLLANVFEAILGALYLDAGYEACKAFIHTILIPRLEEILKAGTHIDAKSRLQELAQEKFSITPVYTVLAEKGPDHEKIFTVGAYFGKDLQGQGDGGSKKDAEQAAARHAMSALGWQ